MKIKRARFQSAFCLRKVATFFMITCLSTHALKISASPRTTNSGPLTLNITVTDVTADIYIVTNILHNGSITVQASGGSAPYQFTTTINNVTGTYNVGYFPGLDPGIYPITVTDAAGNKTDTSVTITYAYPQPDLKVLRVVYPSACDSINGSISLTATGGTPPYLYSIDGGATFNSSGNFTGLPQTFYYAMVKDAKGQIAMVDNGVYSQFGDITLWCNSCNCFGGVYSVSTSACTGQWPLWVEAIANFPRMSFSLDGINYLDLPLLPVYPYNGYRYDTTLTGPGAYKVYIKDSVTGAISIWGWVVGKYCSIAITTVNVNASCQQSNGTITVSAVNGSPPYQYTIDGINYQTSNVFTGLHSGGYYVTVKDAAGNTSSQGTYVSDNCPKISATAAADTCNQKKGSITATGQYGTTPYQFSIDGINFQNSGIFTGLTAGTYKITLRDAGGFADTTTVTVNNQCIEISVLVTNTTCSNKNGSITVNAVNGTAPYQYSIDGINFQTNNVFNNLFAGNYVITVKDSNNISNDTSVIVADASAPKINAAVTQADCFGKNGSINIATNGGTAPLQFSIDNGNNYQSANSFSNLDSATYFIVVNDANNCVSKDTVTITAPPTPVVSLGNDTIVCKGQKLLLQTPFNANYNYLWQDNSTSNQFTVTTAGNYFLKVTNQFNCSSSDTINIKYYSLPYFSLGNDTTACNGHTVKLQPTPVVSGTYLWNDGSTGSFLNTVSGGAYWLQVSDSGCAARDTVSVSFKPAPQINLGSDTTLCEGLTKLLDVTNQNSTYLWQDGSTLPTYLVSLAGTYSVLVDENGCDTSGSIVIQYRSKPQIQLVGDTAICNKESFILNAYYPNSTYLWQDGSTLSYFTVTSGGTYKVDVTNTCGDTSAVSIVTLKNCICKLYIPSSFTPNGDGLNDAFKPGIYDCQLLNYEMKVYNRWGQLMFDTHELSQGWNGQYHSLDQPVGVYLYMITYKDNLTGEEIRNKGTVTLLR